MTDFININSRYNIPSSEIRRDIILTSNYRAGTPPLGLRRCKPSFTYKINGVELSDDYSDGFYIVIRRSNRFKRIFVGLVWNNHYIDVNKHEATMRFWFNTVDYCYASTEIGSFRASLVKKTVEKFLDKLDWLTDKDFEIVKRVTNEVLSEFLKKYYTEG